MTTAATWFCCANAAPRVILDFSTALPVEARSNRLAGMSYDAAGELTTLDAVRLAWDFRHGRLLVGRADRARRRLRRLLRDCHLRRRRPAGGADHPPPGNRPPATTPRPCSKGAETLVHRRPIARRYRKVFQEQRAAPPSSPLGETVAIPDDEGHFCVLERETATARTRQVEGEGTWRGRFLLADQVTSVNQGLDDAGYRPPDIVNTALAVQRLRRGRQPRRRRHAAAS